MPVFLNNEYTTRMKTLIAKHSILIRMENLLTSDEIDWLCRFLEGKGSNNEIIQKIVTITTKLQKMKRK